MNKLYDTLASKEAISATMQALSKNGFLPEFVETSAEALEKIKEIIPAGASVMNGSSQTLEQIGFVDYLKDGVHGWNNLHAGIYAEKDPVKQALLRRQAVLADYYLGSAHTIAQTGELVIASGTGSQLPSLVFTSPTVILIVGVQKIMQDLPAAIARLHEYVIPLEDDRMKKRGASGTVLAKLLIFNRETETMGRNIHIILVNEKLGF